MRLDDALRVRSAVRVEQHRQRRAEVAVGQQHRGREPCARRTRAGRRWVGPAAARRSDVDREPVRAQRWSSPAISSDVARMTAAARWRPCGRRRPASADWWTMPFQRYTCWTVASSSGLPRNVTLVGRRAAIERTWTSGGVTSTPSTRRQRRPSRSAATTSRPSSSTVGLPGTSSTHASSVSSNSTAGVTRRPRWPRARRACAGRGDCTDSSSRSRSGQLTAARYGSASRSHTTSTLPPSRSARASVTSALAVPAAG